jgi:hypothetical protein
MNPHFKLNGKNCIQSAILKQMPFIIFFNGQHPVRDVLVNSEHDQFDPEFFFV